ncbi:MAG: hypothetical protein V7608_2214 [Hyphomicrobiales bacterium]|jgi:tripartite-type tricarboxylate transporter receptor subunit TctC
MKRRAFLAAAMLAAMPGLAFAQYPDRAIRIVVPFAPGAVKAALAKPQVVERGEKAGLDPDYRSSSDLAKRIAEESVVWSQVIKAAGIRL